MQKSFTNVISVVVICLALTACASVLIGNKTQSLLMKAIFKPLVGFDPSEVKLLEKPIIKNRMMALLGTKYEPTMKLLNTAQEIRQEGALFYIASRYAPAQVQQITDKAGMVWNSDTNQLAVLLIKDGGAEILSEQISGAKDMIKPVLPQELQTAYDNAVAMKKTMETPESLIQEMVDDAINPLIQPPVEPQITPPLKEPDTFKPAAGNPEPKQSD